MRFKLWLTAAAGLLFSASACAAPITYNVNIAFSNVSAVGTITTDGVLGPIDQSDITAFNLDITDGATSETIDQTSGNVTFNGTFGVLSTEPQGIDFDFYGPRSYLLFEDTTTGNLLCIENSNGCNVSGDNIFIQTPSTDSVGSGENLIGHQLIAAAPTPEPSGLILLGTGILGALGVARRKLPLAFGTIPGA